jgi:hypothetical protein
MVGHSRDSNGGTIAMGSGSDSALDIMTTVQSQWAMVGLARWCKNHPGQIGSGSAMDGRMHLWAAAALMNNDASISVPHSHYPSSPPCLALQVCSQGYGERRLGFRGSWSCWWRQMHGTQSTSFPSCPTQSLWASCQDVVALSKRKAPCPSVEYFFGSNPNWPFPENESNNISKRLGLTPPHMMTHSILIILWQPACLP